MTSSTVQDGKALPKPRPGGLLPALALGAAYFAGAEIGFALTVAPGALPILWPANAILLGGLLALAPRDWWRALLAVLAAHLLALLGADVPLPLALGWFVSNCAGALIGAAGLYRLLGTRPRFGELRHVVLFLAWCGGLASAASALLDALLVSLWQGGAASSWPPWQGRLLWNAAATLALVPVLAGWRPGVAATLRAQPWTRDLEAGLLVLALAGLDGAAFLAGAVPAIGAPPLLSQAAPWLPPLSSPLLSSPLLSSPLLSFALLPSLFLALSLPVLLWCALRFDPLCTACACLLFAASVVAAAVHGDGAIAGPSSASRLAPQLFLIAVLLPLLPLAAAVQEARRARAALRRCEARLECERDGRRRAVEAGQRCEAEGRLQRTQLAHLARVIVLGELSGAFAHELNQPLAAIRASAHAARRLLERAGPGLAGADLPQVREILDDIVSEDQRASDVIERLRALFMRGEPVRQALDVNELVRESVRLVRASLAEQRVELRLDLAATACRVHGDPVQLQQVLLNLIVNAIEAMRACAPGTRTLRLATSPGGDAAGGVEIAVSDTGAGIAARPVARVFEPFFTTRAHGLGVGLSISRAIVLQHGGRIEAANNPQRGSSFRIVLPPGAADERC